MFRMLLIFLSAMIMLIAGVFQYRWAKSALERESREALDRQWAAMKGYLRLDYDPETQKVADHWYYDSDDPDEDSIVSGIRRASFIADEHGRVLSASPLMRDLDLVAPPGVSSRATPARFVRRTVRGLRYLVRAGIIYDEHHRSPYYVALAAPLSPAEPRMPPFVASLAVVIAGGVLLGWSLGRK